MSNVPTITPGPDDTGRVPEGATETLPLITSAPRHSKTTTSKVTPEYPTMRLTQSSRPSARSGAAKSSSAAASLPASWAALS